MGSLQTSSNCSSPLTSGKELYCTALHLLFSCGSLVRTVHSDSEGLHEDSRSKRSSTSESFKAAADKFFFPHMTTCDLWETHFQSYIHICIYIHIHIYRNVITCLSTTVYSVVTCNFCHTLTLLFPMYTSVYSSSQMPEDVYQTLQMVSLNKAALARFKVKKSNFSLLENGLLFKTKFLAIKYP